jgi:hypothetical protein
MRGVECICAPACLTRRGHDMHGVHMRLARDSQRCAAHNRPHMNLAPVGWARRTACNVWAAARALDLRYSENVHTPLIPPTHPRIVVPLGPVIW